MVTYIKFCVTMEDFKWSRVIALLKGWPHLRLLSIFVDGTHGHRPIQRANIVIVHRPMHIQRIGTTINTAKCRC